MPTGTVSVTSTVVASANCPARTHWPAGTIDRRRWRRGRVAHGEREARALAARRSPPTLQTFSWPCGTAFVKRTCVVAPAGQPRADAVRLRLRADRQPLGGEHGACGHLGAARGRLRHLDGRAVGEWPAAAQWPAGTVTPSAVAPAVSRTANVNGGAGRDPGARDLADLERALLRRRAVREGQLREEPGADERAEPVGARDPARAALVGRRDGLARHLDAVRQRSVTSMTVPSPKLPGRDALAGARPRLS